MIFKRRDRDAADQDSNAAPATPEPSDAEPESVATPPLADEASDSSDGHDSPRTTRPNRDRSDRFSWGAGDIIINPRPAPPVADAEGDGEDDEDEEQPLLESGTDEEEDEEDDDLDDGEDETPVVPSGDQPRKQYPLPRVMAVANQKGGVGKTTTTVNLSAALADLGYRVLVLDLDPQGNATTGLGIDARNFELSMYDVLMRDADLADVIEPTSVGNLFVGPATIDLAGVEIELVSAFSRELKLKRAISSVIDDFDYILIDCPPSLGLITINGLAAATEVLVPIQCEYYALEGLGQLLRNVKLVSGSLNPVLEVSTIVLTMYDSRTRLAADVAMEVRNHFPNEVCDSVIPRTVRLSEAPSFGQPITVFDPTSRCAKAYRALAREVSNGASKRTR